MLRLLYDFGCYRSFRQSGGRLNGRGLLFHLQELNQPREKVRGMTTRQRAFCEHYAACGNAAQAAREADYSEKTARSQAQRLLTNVDILKYVRELQDQAAAGRIASMLQVKAYWSDVLNNPTEKTADRLRAGELLARAAGAFLHIRPGPDDDVGRLAVGEIDGSDVVICLPAVEQEEDCQVKEGETNDG